MEIKAVSLEGNEETVTRAGEEGPGGGGSSGPSRLQLVVGSEDRMTSTVTTTTTTSTTSEDDEDIHDHKKATSFSRKIELPTPPGVLQLPTSSVTCQLPTTPNERASTSLFLQEPGVGSTDNDGPLPWDPHQLLDIFLSLDKSSRSVSADSWHPALETRSELPLPAPADIATNDRFLLGAENAFLVNRAHAQQTYPPPPRHFSEDLPPPPALGDFLRGLLEGVPVCDARPHSSGAMQERGSGAKDCSEKSDGLLQQRVGRSLSWDQTNSQQRSSDSQTQGTCSNNTFSTFADVLKQALAETEASSTPDPADASTLLFGIEGGAGAAVDTSLPLDALVTREEDSVRQRAYSLETEVDHLHSRPPSPFIPLFQSSSDETLPSSNASPSFDLFDDRLAPASTNMRHSSSFKPPMFTPLPPSKTNNCFYGRSYHQQPEQLSASLFRSISRPPPTPSSFLPFVLTKRWQNLNVVLPLYIPHGLISVFGGDGSSTYLFSDRYPSAQLLFSSVGQICDMWPSLLRLRVAVIHKCPEFLVPRVAQIFNSILRRRVPRYSEPLRLSCAGVVKHTIQLRSSGGLTFRYDTIGQLAEARDHEKLKGVFGALQEVMREINHNLVAELESMIQHPTFNQSNNHDNDFFGNDISHYIMGSGASSRSKTHTFCNEENLPPPHKPTTPPFLDAANTKCGLEFRFSPCKELKIAIREGTVCECAGVDAVIAGGGASSMSSWAQQLHVDGLTVGEVRLERDKTTELQVDPFFFPEHQIATRMIVKDQEGLPARICFVDSSVYPHNYRPPIQYAYGMTPLQASTEFLNNNHNNLIKLMPSGFGPVYNAPWINDGMGLFEVHNDLTFQLPTR